MRAERSFAYRNEPVRLQTRFAIAPIARKPPGMALQNLHPRFKSGRRLQIFRVYSGYMGKVYSEEMGNTVGPNGFSIGSNRHV